MKMKFRLQAVSLLALMVFLTGFVVFAADTAKSALPDREADYIWDFSEYTTSVNGSIIKDEYEYKGLTIGLNSDRDNITENGVYWRGMSSRYILYIPEYDGILAAAGKTSEQYGDMCIQNDAGEVLAANNEDGTVIYSECKAGEKYYIMPNADYQRVYYVKYYKTSDVLPTPEPTPDIGDMVYTITSDANGSITEIDTSRLYRNDYVQEFCVTVADSDKKLITQYRTEVCDLITVESKGADKIEVSPVYVYDDIGSVSSSIPLDGYFEDGFYNITFTKGNTNRSGDIYVNGCMVANNLYYCGYNNSFSGAFPHTVNDVVIEGGEICIQITDSKTYVMEKCEVVKSPSIVSRKKKLWVVGDSLVQTYYGTANSELSGQRGWGQFLENFLSDEVEVVNLSNAGHYAERFYSTSFQGVLANAQEGDYFILEGGYNDVQKYSEDKFYAYTAKMLRMAKEKGLIAIAVSPNASLYSDDSGNDFNSVVRFSETVKAAAEDTQSYYVDLSALSYEFYSTVYGTDDEAKRAILETYLFPDIPEDGGLHHSYLGAIKWAEVVIQNMYDQGIINFIDKEYSYKYTDSIGNNFILCIKSAEDEEFIRVESVVIDGKEYGQNSQVTDEGYITQIIFKRNGIFNDAGAYIALYENEKLALTKIIHLANDSFVDNNAVITLDAPIKINSKYSLSVFIWENMKPLAEKFAINSYN